MAVTLTATYKDTLKPDTVAYIDELCGDNGEYGLPCILEFIDEYGEDNCLEFYELYVQQGEEFGYDVVDAWVTENDFDELHKLEDIYAGDFDNGVELAMQIADLEGVCIPDFISVDWDETWDNLKSDYTEVEYQGKTYFFKRWY
jgi:hypothetical protein